MSEWILTMARDWDQQAEHQPVTEVQFVEYDETDDEGFRGHVSLSIQIGPGHYMTKTHRMRPEQFRFFVEQIAGRYAAGGPK